MAPGLVGDLAVAQQHMDEFSFRGDQFACQVNACGRDVVGLGIEQVRELVDAGLVTRAQQLDHLIGQFAIVGDGVERGQRRTERLAPGRDLRLEFRDVFGAPGLGDPEPPRHPRQAEAKSDQGDEDDAEAAKQDQVAIWKAFAVRKRERDGQCRRQRDRAAHPGEGEDEHPLPGRRGIAFAQPFVQQPRQIGCRIDPGKARDDNDDGDQRRGEQDVAQREGLGFLEQRPHLESGQQEQQALDQINHQVPEEDALQPRRRRDQ